MKYAIFPVGGFGHRFEEAGFEQEKPFIYVFERTQIEWSIISCIKNYPNSKIIIGCRGALVDKFEKIVVDIRRKLEIEISVLNIGEKTKGAAHTVTLILEMINFPKGDHEFVVLDNDVAVQILEINSFKNCSAGIVTTKSNNPSHSFIRMDAKKRVIEIAEKRQISNLGVVGNYYFASHSQYLEKYMRIHDFNNEHYISSVIKEYLLAGEIVLAKSADTVVSYGTPIELDFLSRDQFDFLEK